MGYEEVSSFYLSACLEPGFPGPLVEDVAFASMLYFCYLGKILGSCEPKMNLYPLFCLIDLVSILCKKHIVLILRLHMIKVEIN